MHTSREEQPALSISFPRVPQAIAIMWTRLGSRLRERWVAARQERAIARLGPHLRQDTGEIDCRPAPPRQLSETLKAHQQSIEAMWLRGF